MCVDFSHLAPLGPEKTNVGVGLATISLLGTPPHSLGHFGGENAKF
jgi:hypothetical protein